MAGFTKLVPEIIQSSIWNESSDVRVVWITMLAVKDAEGYVRGDVATIARLANVPIEAAKLALEKFQSPDPGSHTADNDGRRIAPAPGGWTVLNHWLYRERDHREEHAAYVREWRKKANKTTDVTERDSRVRHPSASDSASASASEGESEGGYRGLHSALVATGKFPSLTPELVAMKLRLYPKADTAQCHAAVIEAARSLPGGAVGSPDPWLDRTLQRVEAALVGGGKDRRPTSGDARLQRLGETAKAREARLRAEGITSP